MDLDTTCSRDAISWLPNEVLSKILSSLPSKLAASTSVLSKKWRNVFALMHNLDFDDSVSGEYKLQMYGFPVSFKKFVDRTLALQCDYPIKKFSLKCHIGEENDNQEACVSHWISNVIERGVLELDLSIKDMGLRFRPPRQLFESQTLVKLTLGTWLYLGKLPSDMSLPSLKTLFIDTIFFKKEDLCGVLLAGCPILEELSVYHKKFEGTPHTISSQTVKRLSVKYNFPYDNDIWRSSMSFDLPKLVYLEYSHWALGRYSKVNLESLVEVKLNLYAHDLKPDGTDLILGIRNVKILHLSPSSTDAIRSYYRELPVFNNLVKLSFGSQDIRCWTLLPRLIIQSPKLETLIIQRLISYKSYDMAMPLNKVKMLQILEFGGTSNELKSFLTQFKYLELVRVEIAQYVRVDSQTKTKLMKLLGVSLPSKCKIEVI